MVGGAVGTGGASAGTAGPYDPGQLRCRRARCDRFMDAAARSSVFVKTAISTNALTSSSARHVLPSECAECC